MLQPYIYKPLRSSQSVSSFSPSAKTISRFRRKIIFFSRKSLTFFSEIWPLPKNGNITRKNWRCPNLGGCSSPSTYSSAGWYPYGSTVSLLIKFSRDLRWTKVNDSLHAKLTAMGNFYKKYAESDFLLLKLLLVIIQLDQIVDFITCTTFNPFLTDTNALLLYSG